MTGVLHAAAAHADQGQPVTLCRIIDTGKEARSVTGQLATRPIRSCPS